jgi:DNA-binding transcriptional regulator YhcF (GntR family)
VILKLNTEFIDNQKVNYMDFENGELVLKKQERRIRLHGVRRKKERAYLEIKELIDKDLTSTNELALRLSKSSRQIRRYLKNMALLGIVKLDKHTGRLVKKNINYRCITRDSFSKIPVIVKWQDDCIAREVKPKTRRKYLLDVKRIFHMVNENPKKTASSKKSALEFWTKFIVEFRKKYPTRGTHNFRVSYKNFLASFDIVFPPRMGKVYGLSSAHDNYGSYAGIYLLSDITEEIGKLILQDGDIELYTWWRIGLRTGARRLAIAKMTWDRIYFEEKNDDGTESFRLEQHETKHPRGHWFLGENGDWQIKYPPLELKKLLLEWKMRSGDSRFLWFEDSDADDQNRKNAEVKAIRMAKKLKIYYQRIASKVDPCTREYMLKRPMHILRHTMAQQMKDAGFTHEEIADSVGWRTPEIVSTWYTKTSEKKRKELGIRCSKVIF